MNLFKAFGKLSEQKKLGVITLLAVFLAIPITVNLSQRQQTTQQEAAFSGKFRSSMPSQISGNEVLSQYKTAYNQWSTNGRRGTFTLNLPGTTSSGSSACKETTQSNSNTTNSNTIRGGFLSRFFGALSSGFSGGSNGGNNIIQGVSFDPNTPGTTIGKVPASVNAGEAAAGLVGGYVCLNGQLVWKDQYGYSQGQSVDIYQAGAAKAMGTTPAASDQAIGDRYYAGNTAAATQVTNNIAAGMNATPEQIAVANATAKAQGRATNFQDVINAATGK